MDTGHGYDVARGLVVALAARGNHDRNRVSRIYFPCAAARRGAAAFGSPAASPAPATSTAENTTAAR